jgi:hypothetical protein
VQAARRAYAAFAPAFRDRVQQGRRADLDDIKVEVAKGVDPDSVRLVKTGETQVSIGC